MQLEKKVSFSYSYSCIVYSYLLKCSVNRDDAMFVFTEIPSWIDNYPTTIMYSSLGWHCS